MTQRLHHMGITVSDTDTAVAFYSALTGGEVVGPLIKSGPAVEAVTGYPGVHILLTFISFAGGGAVIELAEYRNGSGERIDPDTGKAGSAHPAILVDNIDATLARMAAMGVHATSEPKVATDGPMEGYRYVYLIGPDSVRVELLEAPHAD
ncbi:VOC family protein [Microbacterium sp. CFH 31415]|uniref:VOC family protein n=1 Tax=Microbacterium sp. CFH 31415 TaxID=2921732 RepID=UPI001F13132C|nr:VOC family protein [Microbacterium sp. CFH 31415]MCH6231606.1 VOC family protein [Microbacterium sp. CFH 31415]